MTADQGRQPSPGGAAAPSPADRTRALTLGAVASTICCAVRTIFAIIGVQIKKDLGLTAQLVGAATLSGVAFAQAA